MDSGRLSQESGLLEFGNCLQRIGVAMTCSIDRTVCRTTHKWLRVTNFCGFYSTTKNTLFGRCIPCRLKSIWKGTPVKQDPG